MGWIVLSQFGDFTDDERKSRNDDTPLSFRTLRKIWAAHKSIEDELTELFSDDTKIDEAATKFDEFDPVEDYDFGELVLKLRTFKDPTEWQQHLTMWKTSNPAAYSALTNLFRWLLKAETDSGGNKRAKFKIKFMSVRPASKFDFRIKRFDYHESPGHGQRKFHLDLEIDYVM